MPMHVHSIIFFVCSSSKSVQWQKERIIKKTGKKLPESGNKL